MIGRRWAVPAAALAAAALGACGGSSGSRTSVSSVNPSPAQTVTTTASPTSLATTVPTVFDCGGGAYKPATLLVVCGVATTNVTGVQWTSWDSTGAAGSGTVNLAGSDGHGSGPATLALSKVVPTGNGPQFSQLVVTWSAKSPDGHPTDTFKLAVAPG